MEALFLTCLQAQFLIKRIEVTDLTPKQKNDLIWEVKQVTSKKCKIDGNAARRNGTNHLILEETFNVSSNL